MSDEDKVEQAVETDGAAEPVAAPSKGAGARLKVLLGLLVLCVVGAVGLKVQGSMAARSLAPFAEQKLQEFVKTAAQGEEYASDYTADREFGLYGKLLGKVSVYIKTAKPEGAQYAAVDYIYTRGATGEWEFKESGGSSGAQCERDAVKAFARKGSSK